MAKLMNLLILGLAVLTASAHAMEQMSTWDSLLQNVLSYTIVVIPAALLIRYIQNNPAVLSGPGKLKSIARIFVFGQEEDIGAKELSDAESQAKADEVKDTPLMAALRITFCVVGLQGSYLTWGVLQERIMTHEYGIDENGNPETFTDSQFLVFINRVLALVAAALVIQFSTQPFNSAATYKYSFASMSNILSSWCQYEALKYVSFPTQVLAKSSKIIPVMIMGKFVQSKTYPAYEYICAAVMSLGVATFMFSKASDEGKLDSEEEESTSFSGILLLVGYMVFDSFTSNYQSHMFKSYKMSSYQMMFGVNLFSCFFTCWSLLQRGVFFDCLDFALTHPTFLWHGVLLSITSATGQMFIFYTLSKYGALVFAIIMTTRQVISIFVSAVLFGHRFAPMGWLGILVVFGAMFARIYLRTKYK